MSLNITGKDWKEIHNLIQEIKQKTHITSPFVDYVNNLESSGATFDLSDGHYIFFDDIVYSTSLDYSLKNIDKCFINESEPNSKIFNNLLNQLIRKLQQVNDKSKKLAFDSEKQKQTLLKFYKEQYMKVLDYESPIKLPYELNEKFKDFVPVAKQYLPGYSHNFLKNTIIDEMVDKLEADDLVSAQIASYKYQIHKCNENQLYNPNPKQMLEILFVTLYNCYWPRNKREICQKYGLTFTDSINNQITKKFEIYDNNIKEIVCQIWQEILKQTPNDEFVKNLKNIIDSQKPFNPNDLFQEQTEVYIKEGSRIFIDSLTPTIEK